MRENMKNKEEKIKKTLKNKQQEGITLIALVLTIIILLILAGVSIAMLAGDNGIFTQVQNAKNKTEEAEKNEKLDLLKQEEVINETLNVVEVEQVTDEKPGKLEKEDANTLVINSIEDLVFFSYDVTTNGTTYEGKTVKLGTNLDFNSDKSYVDPNRTDFAEYGYDGNLKQLLTSGNGFIPIGELTSTGTKYFYGTFDGNNNAICSLYINIDRDQTVIVGLFSVTHGEIKNLGLVDTNITVKGEMSTLIGGIAGRGYKSIYNCYVTGNINVTGGYWVTVGGIYGNAYSVDIKNCYNLSNINCQNISTSNDVNIGCGGVIGGGYDNTTINQCFNGGNIIANSSNTTINIAGICSVTHDEEVVVKNCYNFGDIEGIAQYTELEVYSAIGGIVSTSRGSSIKNCYNLGKLISNIKQNSDTGGIIGHQEISNCEISNVFNLGKIEIKEPDIYSVGGILGVRSGNIKINMMDVYNIGKIEANNIAPNSMIGAITGTNVLDLITFNNCYYLESSYDTGLYYGSSDGIQELESIEDFPSVLEVVNGEGAFKEDTKGINNGYPILNYQ